MIDEDNDDVGLQEFVMGLSLLLRGTLLEKLEWTFNLYDINGDGIITADELYMIVSSVYDIIGNFTEPRIDENSIRDHVDTVFKVTPCSTLGGGGWGKSSFESASQSRTAQLS